MNSATLFFILFGLSVAGVAFILWLMWKEKKHSGSDNPEYDKPLRLSKDVTTSPKHVLERAGLEASPAIKTSNKEYTAIDRLTGTAAMKLSPDKTSSHPAEAAQQSPTHPPPETHPVPSPKGTGAVSPEAELSLQVDELKGHLSSLQDKYTQLEKLFDEKGTALDKIQQHLDSELKHRKEFNKIKDILEKEIKDQKDKVKQMQGELSNAELENQNSTKRITQLEEKIKLIDSDKLELEAAAKKARMDLEDVTRAKEAIEFTIAEKDQKISQLVQRLHDLAAGSSTAVAGLRPDVIESSAEVPEQKETPETDTRPASTDSEKIPAEAPQDTPEISGPSDSETAETGAATELPAEKHSKKEDTELPPPLPATPSVAIVSSEDAPVPAPEPTVEKDESAGGGAVKAAGTPPEEVDTASVMDPAAAPGDTEPDHENSPLRPAAPAEDDGATETESEPGRDTSDYTLSDPDEAGEFAAFGAVDEKPADHQELAPTEPAAYPLNDTDEPDEMPPAGQTVTDDETKKATSENDIIWITPDDREEATEAPPPLPDTKMTKDEEQQAPEQERRPFASMETGEAADHRESVPSASLPETGEKPETTEPEDPRDQFGRAEPDMMPPAAADEAVGVSTPTPVGEPPNIFRSESDDDTDIADEGPGWAEPPELSTPIDKNVGPDETPAFRPMVLSDAPDSGTEDDIPSEADATETPPSLRPDIVPSPEEELDSTPERPVDPDDFSVNEDNTHQIREDGSDREEEGTTPEISPEPAPDNNSDLSYIEEIDTKLFDDPKPVPEYNDDGAYQLETLSYKLTDETDTESTPGTEDEASEPQEAPFEEALSQLPDEEPEPLLDEELLTEPKPPFEAGQRPPEEPENEPQPSAANHKPDEQQTEQESPDEKPASDADVPASSPSSLFDASIRNAKQLLSMMEEEDDFSPEESEEEDDQKQNE